jgi:hypothetical protein
MTPMTTAVRSVEYAPENPSIPKGFLGTCSKFREGDWGMIAAGFTRRNHPPGRLPSIGNMGESYLKYEKFSK